jgi:hypothetical protein
VNESEGWLETVVHPGAAAEIGNARYPAEENIEDDFSIVKVEMHGSSGDLVLDGGTRAIFNRLNKEDDGFFDSLKGKSPRYIYRYK